MICRYFHRCYCAAIESHILSVEESYGNECATLWHFCYGRLWLDYPIHLLNIIGGNSQSKKNQKTKWRGVSPCQCLSHLPINLRLDFLEEGLRGASLSFPRGKPTPVPNHEDLAGSNASWSCAPILCSRHFSWAHAAESLEWLDVTSMPKILNALYCSSDDPDSSTSAPLYKAPYVSPPGSRTGKTQSIYGKRNERRHSLWFWLVQIDRLLWLLLLLLALGSALPLVLWGETANALPSSKVPSLQLYIESSRYWIARPGQPPSELILSLGYGRVSGWRSPSEASRARVQSAANSTEAIPCFKNIQISKYLVHSAFVSA